MATIDNNKLPTDVEMDNIMKLVDMVIEALPNEHKSAIKEDFDKGIINIDLSNDIADALAVVFKSLLTICTSNEAYYCEDNTVIVDGNQLSVYELLQNIAMSTATINLGIAAPLLNLLTCFKHFFEEVNLGVGTIKATRPNTLKRDRAGTTIKPRAVYKQIYDYGLSNLHLCLCAGATLEPEFRLQEGILESLGPMTLAMSLISEKNTENKNRIKGVLAHAIGMLPMCEEIIQFLEKATPHRWQTQDVMKELGDVFLLINARTRRRAYLPILLAKFLWENKGDSYQWTFWDRDLFKLYSDLASADKFSYKIRTNGDPDVVSEAIFHAIIGSHLDDLGLLSQVTTRSCQWSRWKDMRDVYKNRNKADVQIVKPIYFRAICALSQDYVDDLRITDSMTLENILFTRDRNSDQKHNAESVVFVSSDAGDLTLALNQLKMKFFERMTLEDPNEALQAGTTRWLLKTERGWKEDANFIAKGNATHFH